MEDQIFFDNKFIFFQEKNKDDFFYGSLVYIVEHNSNGAIGIVVNKLISVDENQIYKSLGIKSDSNHKSLLNGGPVDINKLFIIHEKPDHNESIANL
jgi:putative transcriptional regulator